MSKLINGTKFDYEVSTAPRCFVTQRKIDFNKTEHTVKRILVVKFRVVAKHKTPESMTFATLFLTTNDRLLDPRTCDVVGELHEDDTISLNPTYVHEHEHGTKRVRPKTIKFEMDPLTSWMDDLGADIPDSEKNPSNLSPGCRAAKSVSFTPRKQPRFMAPVEDIQDSEDEDPGTGTDLDDDVTKDFAI